MAYSRYNDQLNRYLAELDRLQGVYDSERDYDYSRFQNDQAFDYGMYTDAQNMQYQLDRDAAEDARYDQEWAYQQERDRIADEQWQKQFDESVRQYNENMAWQKQQAAARSSGGGGGGRSSGGSRSQSSVSDDDKKAMDFVENMLNNATSSAFDPSRVISGTNVLSSSQKKTAQEYLNKIISSGAMKSR